jgi:hypothetical protein
MCVSDQSIGCSGYNRPANKLWRSPLLSACTRSASKAYQDATAGAWRPQSFVRVLTTSMCQRQLAYLNLRMFQPGSITLAGLRVRSLIRIAPPEVGPECSPAVRFAVSAWKVNCNRAVWLQHDAQLPRQRLYYLHVRSPSQRLCHCLQHLYRCLQPYNRHCGCQGVVEPDNTK